MEEFQLNEVIKMKILFLKNPSCDHALSDNRVLLSIHDLLAPSVVYQSLSIINSTPIKHSNILAD